MSPELREAGAGAPDASVRDPGSGARDALGPDSLKKLLCPRSVAVVGASRDPASLGHRLLETIVAGRFQGAVYPVHPTAPFLGSIRAYASLRDLPEVPDLAVVMVPAGAVEGVIDDCAALGVGAAVVITAGFAETGAEGKAVQDRILARARAAGLRLAGPNCMGIANAAAGVRLNASLSGFFPRPGRIAMASQSGALGISILSLFCQRELGLSSFVSLGNKADVSGNDLLEYWEEDPGTDMVLLYLESFGNPRRFVPIARRLARAKPVIAVKSGRSGAGSRAAGSHTAALAADDAAVEALLRQSGVVRVGTIEEMFDLASLLSAQPLPPGARVGIVTNAGGPAILCADACEAGGLSIPELSAGLQERLGGFLPRTAGLRNPLDMIASARGGEYRRAVEAVLGSGEVDALVVIHTPVDPSCAHEVRAAVAEAVRAARGKGGAGRPVLLCQMSQEGAGAPLMAGDERIPLYPFPENAARALGRAAAYARWRSAPEGAVPHFSGLDVKGARVACRAALAARGDGWLLPAEAAAILAAAGIPALPGEAARTSAEAAEAAARLGFPVALKLASRTIVHKSDVGGVELGLRSAAEAERAFDRIAGRLRAAGRLAEMEGVWVQPMAPAGVEVMAGARSDPLFGHLVVFGLGGVFVEILRDVSIRVAPLTDRDAREMRSEIRGARLLAGYRGHPSADVRALEEMLLRISALVRKVPEIAELDLNPVFALPPGRGLLVADARIRAEAAHA